MAAPTLAEQIAAMRHCLARAEAEGEHNRFPQDPELDALRAVLATLESIAGGDYAALAELHAKHHAAMIAAATGKGSG